MYKPSISREFHITLVTILCITVIFSLLSTYFSYKIYKSEIQHQYSLEANKIVLSLTKNFDYINNLSKFV